MLDKNGKFKGSYNYYRSLKSGLLYLESVDGLISIIELGLQRFINLMDYK
jgi:hypothetical protein